LRRFAQLVMGLAICAVHSASAGAQDARETGSNAKPQDAAVRAQMRNVKYRFTDDVAVHISSLNGALVPVKDYELPILDAKDSFKIRIDSGEVAVGPGDLSELLNRYIFRGSRSPLTDLSVVLANGGLRVKGKLHRQGDVPFESEGVLTPTPDGKIRLESQRMKAFHLPVKRLMDLFGIDVSDLIKNGKIAGVTAEGNALVLDLNQILPPPRIDGRVVAIRVDPAALVLTFGGGQDKEKPGPKMERRSYMAYQGRQLRVANLTVTGVDLALFDVDANATLDFFLDRYRDQLAAGFTKITPNFALRVYLKGFGKLTPTNPSARSQDSAN
jgi:hypothetical protein